MHIQIVTHFLKKYKALLLYITVFLGFFLLSGESLFANEDGVLSQEDSEKVVEILNLIITGAAALMGMVTSFITMFLYPGWTNGTLFGLQDYLKEIWILVSNVVYFIFAFILITIAFMNIIGRGDGNWELKQAMPKFIVGVLIVPFSWFFVQFLLSISAILTVGVLTLPYDSFNDHELFVKALDNTELAGEEICKDVVISFNGDFEGKDVEQLSSEENDLDENVKCLADGKITIKELITGVDEDGNTSSDAAGLQNSIFGIISIYSYGILRIHDLDTITGSDLESVETIVDLVFKIVFDVLFVLVYLLLMIALLLALFVRGVRLWIYMMLSPVFGLFYFFSKDEVSNDGGAKFGVKEFIHLSLIPVYVSAALAFGLVFILVAGEGIKETNEDEDTLKAGGFSLTILGAHGSGESEKSVIGKLIVEIFGIAILWIAVMFALSRSETTGNIIKPIADFGNSVGKLAAAAPTYAPIIPTGGGKSMGVAGLGQMGQSIQSGYHTSQTQRGSDFAKGFLPGSASVQVDLSQSAERALTRINNGDTQSNETWSELTKTLREGGSTSDLAQNDKVIEMLKKMLEASGNAEHNTIGENLVRGDVSKMAAAIGAIDEYGRTIGRDAIGGNTGDGRLTARSTRTEIDAAITGAVTVDTSDLETPITDTNNTFNVNIGGQDITTPTDALTALNASNRADLDEKMRIANIPAESRQAIITAFEEGVDTADGDTTA